jgi:GTPase SAR1 family protein
MTDVYEQSRANLGQLALWYQKNFDDRNEATTRLHMIDRLFLDCLSWTRNDIIAEDSHDGQYADYTFLAPRKILIVEAKREGISFDVPAGLKRLEYSLRTLSQDNPDLKAALEQTASYCQTRGVPLGAVCNGHQLVVFIATRNDGTSPLEGRALVFPSLEFMHDHFIELWQALSKPGIEERRVLRRLLGTKSPDIPPRLSASIPGYPKLKQRNIYQTDLQIVSELVLEDIVSLRDIEPAFLQECYCKSGALSQYSLISKSILAARYAALFDSESPGPTTVPAVDKEGITDELLAESMSRRPILIIGDVGVGKTTFIRYILKVEAIELLKEAIALYIDLGSQATLVHDLRDFIIDEIDNQLRTEYEIDTEERNFVRGVYHFDLERFKRGIYSDLSEINPEAYREKELTLLEEKVGNKEEHLKRLIEHLVRGHKKQVVLFLDNVDQRHEDVQQETFLISQELAERCPATVFVTLRPATFHRSRKIGSLSGYHPKAFTIAPPRIDLVLDKRLEFALKMTSGQIPIKSHRVQLGNLDSIVRVFYESLKTNPDLVELLDNICGGNVRSALDIVRNFFGSGHVDTKKIVETYQQQGSYVIPIHEFLRAVIYEDHEHYDPNRSIVANLYDVSYFDPKEHFLLPVILSLLVTERDAGVDEGFVETARLYEGAQALGFIPEQIDAAILRAHRHMLIEASGRRRPNADQPMPPSLRATTIGAYHVSRLCKLFVYLDAVVVDTPIFDSEARAAIQDEHSIERRLDRAEIFISYLDKQWASLEKKPSTFHWPSISSQLRAEISRIRARPPSQQFRFKYN